MVHMHIKIGFRRKELNRSPNPTPKANQDHTQHADMSKTNCHPMLFMDL